MKVTIFGATGRTGLPLVRQALAQGHEVTAFVRDPARLGISDERLRTVQGDIRDAERVEEAVAGADAVLSVLALSKGADDQTVGARNIVTAMEKHGVRRFVSLIGAGVRFSSDPTQSMGGRMIATLLKLLAGNVLRDAKEHTERVVASDLDWTLVRPPRLTEGPHTGTYCTGSLRLGPGDSIARADVADFMLKLATEGEYVREAPMVAS